MYRSSVSLQGRRRSPDCSTMNRQVTVESSSPLHAVSSARNATSSIRPRPNHSAMLRAELARAKIAANSCSRIRASSTRCIAMSSRDTVASSSLDPEKRRMNGRASSPTMRPPTTMTGLPIYDWNGRPPRGPHRRSTSGVDPTHAPKVSPSSDQWHADAFWDELPSTTGGGATSSAKLPTDGPIQSCYGSVPRSSSVSRMTTYANHSDSDDDYDSDMTGGDEHGIWSRRCDERSAMNEKRRRQSLPPRGRRTSGGSRSRSTSGGPLRDVETRQSRTNVMVASRSCPPRRGSRAAVIADKLSASVEHLIDDIRRLQECLAEKTAQLSYLLKCSDRRSVLGKFGSPQILPASTACAQVNHVDDHRVGKSNSCFDDADDQLALAIAESYKTALAQHADDCTSQPSRNQPLVNGNEDTVADGGTSDQFVPPASGQFLSPEVEYAQVKQNSAGIRPDTSAGQLGRQRHVLLSSPSPSSSSSSGPQMAVRVHQTQSELPTKTIQRRESDDTL